MVAFLSCFPQSVFALLKFSKLGFLPVVLMYTLGYYVGLVRTA